MRVTVSTSGFKELEQALTGISKASTAKAVMQRALRKAGEPVADKMRDLAPVDDGQLKANIAVSTQVKNEAGKAAFAKHMRNGGDRAGAVRAMRDARRAAKASGAIPVAVMFVGPTTKAPHAHLVEFGTAPHITGGRFPGALHPGTTPQPFARPAWDAEQAATLDRIGKAMWIEIEKQAKRAAAKAAKGR